MNLLQQKISKKRFLQGFLVVTVLLALVRCIFPSVAEPKKGTTNADSLSTDTPRLDTTSKPDTMAVTRLSGEAKVETNSRFFDSQGHPVKNRIYSVPNFGRAFPDQNDVQLIAAQRWGVKPVNNRDEAEARKKELVYVGANPYFYVDRLRSSIPYLVPRASILLQDIGRSFFDSLQTKTIPLHKIIVTSVMRSQEDVQKLRGHNSNATQNSCHLYGTTFDVCYNRYKTVEPPEGPERRKVRNDTLKWVLSEVLNDMREQNRCYIKYEVHQGCFHITVR